MEKKVREIMGEIGVEMIVEDRRRVKMGKEERGEVDVIKGKE